MMPILKWNVRPVALASSFSWSDFHQRRFIFLKYLIPGVWEKSCCCKFIYFCLAQKMLQVFVSVYVLSMLNTAKIPKQLHMHKSTVEYNWLTPLQEVHYGTSWLVLWEAHVEEEEGVFTCLLCMQVSLDCKHSFIKK